MSAPEARDLALGVDIGGTFTDLALLDRRSGRIFAGKVLTDYDDFARGVLDGISRLLMETGTVAEDVRLVVHGTTLATNALIERRGARTALVVTDGFRDVLETARGTRYDIFDLEVSAPDPLVPRARVLEASERIDHSGRVIRPLAPEQADMLAARLAALEVEVESVAICLLHAYANPAHERAIGAAIARHAPGLAVSLSSEVIPAIGEYERATTTVANVYLQPVVRGYLDRLQEGLRALGLPQPPLVMTSDGGTIACSTAVAYPVRLLESGPAGGAIAAAYLGERAGLDRVIGFDMGGTTAKICIIDDQQPARTTEFEAARVERFAKGSGLPLKVPALEMIEIGSGGGSIAKVDPTGLLKVGPESAGAAPGPACYGFAGDDATVTDANLCLGYLDPGYFLGGTMPLDKAAARAAIVRNIATPLGLPVTRAAWGIHEVVNHNMARAAKIHCLEQGRDPRRYTLVAFGGAGPIHAYGIAQALGIPRVFYPARAGILSAVGFLVARPSFELLRSYQAALTSGSLDEIDPLFAEMEAQGCALLSSAGVPARLLKARRELGVRYVGQASVLYVDVPRPPARPERLAAVAERFVADYRSRYHRAEPDGALELVSLRVTVSGPRPDAQLEGVATRVGRQAAALKGHRDVYVAESASFVSCPVYDRYALTGALRGPAVIEERESTVVVGPGALIEVDVSSNLLVALPGRSQPARPVEPRPATAAS